MHETGGGQFVNHDGGRDTAAAAVRVVKTEIDPLQIVGELRNVIGRIDPDLPLADVQTMDDVVAGSLRDPWTPTVLLAGFGAVALVLAALGLHSVLAFGVSRRVQTHSPGRSSDVAAGAVKGDLA